MMTSVPMELVCDTSVANAYKSAPQRARVVSEGWFAQNSYCLACDADRLYRTPSNTAATDFTCNGCGQRYELKTFLKRPGRSLVDGAYLSPLGRIQAGTAPTLCLLERSDCWRIRSLTAIHSSFLTPWVIEQRRPLSQVARRAGWVGCNIRLDRIPPDGEINVIGAGVACPKAEVRNKFQRFLPLASLPVGQRGWTTLTLSVIRKLGRPQFSLGDLYLREEEFSAFYPSNRHVRAKIRQQLQNLRDLGMLSFEGRGEYRLSV
jgi:type II restriction enzyme